MPDILFLLYTLSFIDRSWLAYREVAHYDINIVGESIAETGSKGIELMNVYWKKLFTVYRKLDLEALCTESLVNAYLNFRVIHDNVNWNVDLGWKIDLHSTFDFHRLEFGSLKELEVWGFPFTTLEGFHFLKGLRKLQFKTVKDFKEFSQIESLSRLISLNTSEWLKIYNPKQFSNISKLTQLRDLALDIEGIKDPSFKEINLEPLANLRLFNLRGDVNSIKGLSKLTKLTHLYIEGQISEIDALPAAPDLEELLIKGPITNLTFLPEYPNLKEATIFALVDRLEGLRGLRSIQKLYLNFFGDLPVTYIFLPDIKKTSRLNRLLQNFEQIGRDLEWIWNRENISFVVPDFEEIAENWDQLILKSTYPRDKLEIIKEEALKSSTNSN